MKHKKIWLSGSVLLLIPIAMVVFIWICEGKSPFTVDYDLNQWIGIVGALLTYAGTGSLGVLAFWQNEKANDINDNLVKIEEVRTIPSIYIRALTGTEKTPTYDMCVSIKEDIKDRKRCGIYLFIGNSKSEKIVYSKICCVKFDNKVIRILKNVGNSFGPCEEKKIYFDIFESEVDFTYFCKAKNDNFPTPPIIIPLTFSINLVNSLNKSYIQTIEISIEIENCYIKNICKYEAKEPLLEKKK